MQYRSTYFIYFLLMTALFLQPIINYAQLLYHDTIIRPTAFKPFITYDSTYMNNSVNDTNGLKKESWREFTNYFRLDFFTTINAFQYVNARDPTTDKNNAYLYYNLNITNQFTTKYISLNTYFFNELGYRKYIDSISIKNEDAYFYKVDVNSPLVKNVNVNVSYQVKSQFWKSWTYKPDSLQHLQPTLYSSYFSPGYIIFSGGISLEFWSTCRAELGLVGGQITKVKNDALYVSRKEDELYGIKKGDAKQIEFGLSLQLQVPAKKIGKFLYWENSSHVFVKSKNIKQRDGYQLDFNNGIHFLFLKYLRLGIRTKVMYDTTVSEKLYISNILLFGFYLSNKL